MLRRVFLRKFGRRAGLGFFVFVGNLTLFPLLLKSKKENKNSAYPFYYGFRCASNKYPHKVYENDSEFWNDHPDKISKKLNDFFYKKGWLIATRSSLLKGGKEVSFEKYYKTEFHSELYDRIWLKLSNEKPKEYENVKYTFFKKGKKSIHYFT